MTPKVICEMLCDVTVTPFGKVLYVHTIGPVFVADWNTVNDCPAVDVEKTNGLRLVRRGVAPDAAATLIRYESINMPW